MESLYDEVLTSLDGMDPPGTTKHRLLKAEHRRKSSPALLLTVEWF